MEINSIVKTQPELAAALTSTGRTTSGSATVASKVDNVSLESLTTQNNEQTEQTYRQHDADLIEKSIEKANQELSKSNRFIQRSVHEVTHAVIYTVRDTRTNEVITEFPQRKIQDMIAKIWELAGLFVDENA